MAGSLERTPVGPDGPALTAPRHTRSKGELVTAAVAALVSEVTVPDTGSTQRDLVELMRSAVDVYSGSVPPCLTQP